MDTQTTTPTPAAGLTADDYARISRAISDEFGDLYSDLDPYDCSAVRSNLEIEIPLADDPYRCMTLYADLELCYHTTADELDYYGGTGRCGETLVDSWDVAINHARLYDETFDDWIPVTVDRAMLNLD